MRAVHLHKITSAVSCLAQMTSLATPQARPSQLTLPRSHALNTELGDAVAENVTAGAVEDESPDLAQPRPTIVEIGTPDLSNRPSRERYHPGSDIDRPWRYVMLDFLLGALPQSIKMFATTVIPVTRALVEIYLFTFVVPELFRLLAGPTGAVELHSPPVVHETKELLHHVKAVGVVLAVPILYAIYIIFVMINFVVLVDTRTVLLGPIAISTVVIGSVTLTYEIFKRTPLFSLCTARLNSLDPLTTWCGQGYDMVSTFLSATFALQTPTFITGPQDLLTPVLALLISISPSPNSRAIADFFVFLASGPAGVMLSPLWVCTFYISTIFAASMSFHLLYKFISMGSWSRLPRRLTRVSGSMCEYWSANVILVWLLFIASQYMRIYDSKNTYKTPWTEFLA